MTFDLNALLALARFEHEWLADEFAAESRRLAERENATKHHYVPRSYLARWAVDGLVQPTLVDQHRTYQPQLPKEVANPKKRRAASTRFERIPKIRRISPRLRHRSHGTLTELLDNQVVIRCLAEHAWPQHFSESG